MVQTLEQAIKTEKPFVIINLKLSWITNGSRCKSRLSS